MLRLALLGAFALSGCASTKAEGRDCFRNMDVRGYGIVDDHRVRLRVSSTRSYIVTIRQNTRDFDPAQPIALRSPSSFVCVGNPGNVELLSGDRFPAHVTSIERAQADVADQSN